MEHSILYKTAIGFLAFVFLYIAYKMYIDYKLLKIFYKKYATNAEYRNSIQHSGWNFDWIGRVYKLIEIPNEFNNPTSIGVYLQQQIKMIFDSSFVDVSEILGIEIIPKSNNLSLVIISTYRKYLKKRWILFQLLLLASIVGMYIYI